MTRVSCWERSSCKRSLLCLFTSAYLCSGTTAQFWIDPADSLGLLPPRPRYQRDNTQGGVGFPTSFFDTGGRGSGTGFWEAENASLALPQSSPTSLSLDSPAAAPTDAAAAGAPASAPVDAAGPDPDASESPSPSPSPPAQTRSSPSPAPSVNASAGPSSDAAAAPGASPAVPPPVAAGGVNTSSPTHMTDLVAPGSPSAAVPPPPPRAGAKAPPPPPKVGGARDAQGAPGVGSMTCAAHGLTGPCNSCVCCCTDPGAGGFVRLVIDGCNCRKEVLLTMVLSLICLLPALLAACFFAECLPLSPYKAPAGEQRLPTAVPPPEPAAVQPAAVLPSA